MKEYVLRKVEKKEKIVDIVPQIKGFKWLIELGLIIIGINPLQVIKREGLVLMNEKGKKRIVWEQLR